MVVCVGTGGSGAAAGGREEEGGGGAAGSFGELGEAEGGDH